MFLSANVVSTENLGYLGSYPVTISWLDDTKECIQSGKSKQRDSCFSAHMLILSSAEASFVLPKPKIIKNSP